MATVAASLPLPSLQLLTSLVRRRSRVGVAEGLSLPRRRFDGVLAAGGLLPRRCPEGVVVGLTDWCITPAHRPLLSKTEAVGS